MIVHLAIPEPTPYDGGTTQRWLITHHHGTGPIPRQDRGPDGGRDRGHPIGGYAPRWILCQDRFKEPVHVAS